MINQGRQNQMLLNWAPYFKKYDSNVKCKSEETIFNTEKMKILALRQNNSNFFTFLIPPSPPARFSHCFIIQLYFDYNFLSVYYSTDILSILPLIKAFLSPCARPLD